MEDYSKVFKIGEVYNCQVRKVMKGYAEVSLIDGIGRGFIESDLDLKVGEIYPLQVYDFSIVSSLPPLIFEPTLETYVLCGNRPKLLTFKVIAMSHTKLALNNPEYSIIFDRKDLPIDTNWSWVLHSIEVAQFKSGDNIRNVIAGLILVDGSKVPLYDWEAKAKWEGYQIKESRFRSGNWLVGKTYALEFNNGWIDVEHKKLVRLSNSDSVARGNNFALAKVIDIINGTPLCEVITSFHLDK